MEINIDLKWVNAILISILISILTICFATWSKRSRFVRLVIKNGNFIGLSRKSWKISF